MDRILIIGLNGSGKSTLANKLGKLLNIEVFHLDKLYFKPGWKAVEKGEWLKIVQDIISKEKWIIDGTYPSSLDKRIERSDTIIFLNFNKLLCLYGIFIRIFDRKQPFDRPEGDFHKLSWFLIKKVLNYPKNHILQKIEKQKDTKKIFIIKNNREKRELVEQLSK